MNNCLICVSGSVAAVKVPELAVELSKSFNIYLVCTEKGKLFLEKAQGYNSTAWKEFISIGGWHRILTDEDEFSTYEKIGDKVLHIELRRWADIIVVAPASADLIAKSSLGISDNLALSTIRAWDYNSKPCIICPAMNTLMWDHPATRRSLATLQEWGWQVVGPVAKVLACSDEGNGALADVVVIRDAVIQAALSSKILKKSISFPSASENIANIVRKRKNKFSWISFPLMICVSVVTLAAFDRLLTSLGAISPSVDV